MGDHRQYDQDMQGPETMNKPGIVTAIPRRRYTYGEFSVAILGEIESNDAVTYRYIMAVMKGSDPAPGIYITAEQAGTADPDPNYNMRIIMRDGAEIIGTSTAWGDLDAFASEALGVVGQVLNLSDEVPYQLM